MNFKNKQDLLVAGGFYNFFVHAKVVNDEELAAYFTKFKKLYAKLFYEIDHEPVKL